VWVAFVAVKSGKIDIAKVAYDYTSFSSKWVWSCSSARDSLVVVASLTSDQQGDRWSLIK